MVLLAAIAQIFSQKIFSTYLVCPVFCNLLGVKLNMSGMKKAKQIILVSYNLLIAGFMAILGFFSSCSDSSTDEYGSPYALFKAKGNVSSATTQQSIVGIKVMSQQDTVFTGTDGQFEINAGMGIPTGQSFNLKFQDSDGAANGEFQELDTIIEFNNPVFTGGDGHWNQGETEKEFNVQLKGKE